MPLDPYPPGSRVSTWNPREHTHEENLRWSWLRAIEWGNWPVFISQPSVPLLLIWFPWYAVLAGLFVLNISWALLVRYNVVNVTAAYAGVIIVLAKWVTWPVATIYMVVQQRRPECWVALGWPLLMWTPGFYLPTQVGRIQTLFMRALGYGHNPLAGEETP